MVITTLTMNAMFFTSTVSILVLINISSGLADIKSHGHHHHDNNDDKTTTLQPDNAYTGRLSVQFWMNVFIVLGLTSLSTHLNYP